MLLLLVSGRVHNSSSTKKLGISSFHHVFFAQKLSHKCLKMGQGETWTSRKRMVPVQQHVISQLEFPTGPIPWTFTWMQFGDLWDIFDGPGVKRPLFRRLGRSDCSPENCQEASEFRTKISFYGHVFPKKSHSSQQKPATFTFNPRIFERNGLLYSMKSGEPPLAVRFSQVSSLP